MADGALYNYFADKDDLLAHGLLAHVGAVMSGAPPMPAAGTGTVAGNLALFIDQGLDVLGRVAPAFAGLQSQPGVLTRFQAMVGGHAALGVADGDGTVRRGDGSEARGAAGAAAKQRGRARRGGGRDEDAGPAAGGPRGLPDLLTAYLDAEQRLGRVSAAADLDAAVMLVVGAIHGQVLPQVLLGPPGRPPPPPPAFAGRLATIVMNGLAPG